MKKRVELRKVVAQTGIRRWTGELNGTSCGRNTASGEGDTFMRTWERVGYEVVEKAFDYDLHEFDVVKEGEVVATITPPDLDSQADITAALDAGEDVNGWEDGKGNTISV